MWRVALVFVLWLAQTPMARPAVPPIPEAEQAARALELINAYHAPRPASVSRKLHIVYFTPSGRAPEPRYRERLEPILEDIRAFYRDGMSRSGFGPKTFDLARDADGKLIIHLVQGKEPEAAYTRSGFQQDQESDVSTRNRIQAECRPAIEAAGISFEHETVLIFCNLTTWNEKSKTFIQHSPYCGFSTQTNRVRFALDTVIQNLEDIPRNVPILNDDQYCDMSLGKFNTIFIGSIAHELGHAFALPHCGERWDEKLRGTSLMGIGTTPIVMSGAARAKALFSPWPARCSWPPAPSSTARTKGKANPANFNNVICSSPPTSPAPTSPAGAERSISKAPSKAHRPSMAWWPISIPSMMAVIALPPPLRCPILRGGSLSKSAIWRPAKTEPCGSCSATSTAR